MPIDVEVRGLIETQRKLEKQVADLHGEPVLEAVRTGALLIDRDAKINTPVDTGRLRASIIPSVTADGNDIIGIVGSNVIYAAAVETGTKPHMPPVDAIEGWVRRKNLAGSYSVKTHGRLGGAARQESENRSMAWAIAIKISRVGTQGAHMLQNAFDTNKDRVMRLIKSAVDKATKQ